LAAISAIAKHKLCALASLAMVLLSLIPEAHLWLVRGREWNGAYVQIQGDEHYYASYLNSLLHGRPRRNDPYGGLDDRSGAPLPESTFSIQFIPPYVMTTVARLFGASASTIMIALLAVGALLASLALCWLLRSVTDDYALAAAGTLFVLCFGGLAGGHALLGLLLVTKDLSMPSLPFLRRYQPAASFPLLILFIGLVWQALRAETRRRIMIAALLAGVTFGLLIFSYLYLWTAAAAWLTCICIFWFWLRPKDRRQLFTVLGIIIAIVAIVFVPYAYLVSHRPPTLDEQQTVAFTHRPDLLRVPELLGVLILIILFIAIRRRQVARDDSRLVLTASLALLSLVVFNQQILTGTTIQPYHYAAFVVNYTVLISLVIAASLWWKQIPRRALIWIAALSFMWGFIEVGLPSRLNTVPAAIANDQMVPVLRRLDDLSQQDGTMSDLKTKGRASTIVFSTELTVSVMLPAWTSQPTLLDIGGLDFGSLTREVRREYFLMHLYYANANPDALRHALRGVPDDPAMNYYARSVLFGHERIVPALAGDFKPIRDEEIENEIRTFQDYARNFSRAQAVKRPLVYAIIKGDSNFDFANVDRWYDRDSGERVGAYTLYRLKLREQSR
jgi:hypothetical protein